MNPVLLPAFNTGEPVAFAQAPAGRDGDHHLPEEIPGPGGDPRRADRRRLRAGGDTRRALADLAESASRLIMVDDADAADDAAAAYRIVQVMICREDGVTPVLTGSSVVRTGAVAAWTLTRVLAV